jgi:hypothetical protein
VNSRTLGPQNLPNTAAASTHNHTHRFQCFRFKVGALCFARLRPPAGKFFLWLLACVFFLSNGAAFVFYPVGNQLLRWNVGNSLAHTNVVNPATKSVRYFIASDAYSPAHREAEIAAVQACFDQWQSVPGSSLKFEFAGFVSPTGMDVRRDNTNVVFWAKQSTLVDGGAMNISGLRAWTSVQFANDGSILEADIVLNGSQYQWFTDFNDTVSQAQFIESVLLHEIGHFIGLDHSAAGGATLAIGASGVSPEAGLSEDEVAAMRFLYPSATTVSAKIFGIVRLSGNPILGAAVVAEDSHGNLAGATVTRADGTYDLAGLPAGTYHVRVAPLDPANTGVEKLIRGADVAPEYAAAVTSFAATTNFAITLSAGQNRALDFALASGPPMRITSISIPTTIPDLISVVRTPVTLQRGQANYFVAVSGATLKSGASLGIGGDGITMGPTTFLENRIAGSIHSLVATVSVASNATPGLRSFVVKLGNDVAYANGFVEIAPAFPDYNFDNLDDRFQRRYWRPWTSVDSAPSSDPDSDLFSNTFEFRTGTNPLEPSSYRLPITSVNRTPNAATITLESEAGKRYQLYATAVLGSGSWEAIGSLVTAVRSQLTLTDGSGGGSRFYRVALVP